MNERETGSGAFGSAARLEILERVPDIGAGRLLVDQELDAVGRKARPGAQETGDLARVRIGVAKVWNAGILVLADADHEGEIARTGGAGKQNDAGREQAC